MIMDCCNRATEFRVVTLARCTGREDCLRKSPEESLIMKLLALIERICPN